MIIFIKLLIVIFFVIFIAFTLKYICVTTTIKWVKARRQNKQSKLLKSIYLWTYHSHVPREDFSCLIHKSSPRKAAMILTQLGELCAGYIPMRLERYVAWLSVDKYILRIAKRNRALKRALALKTLFLIPLPRWSVKLAITYKNDRNSYVRLYALLIHLKYDFSRAKYIIRQFNHDFSALDYSIISQFLFKRGIYQGFDLYLLQHDDLRLQTLGLYMIRMMNITSSAEEVAQMLPSENKEMNYALLRTLIVLHYSLEDDNVADAFSSLEHSERKILYRLTFMQGYSFEALEALLEREKISYMVEYVKGLIAGEKCKLN